MRLENNSLWVPSRIILPPHRDAIVELQNKQYEKDRSALTEEELVRLSYRLQESLHLRVSVTLQMYDKFEETYVVGMIDRIDVTKKKFNINGDWFNISDVEKMID